MNKAENVHIVYCSNENYMLPTLVSAGSACVFATAENPFVIHLIDSGVDDGTYDDFERRLTALNPFVSVVRHRWKDQEYEAYPAWHGSRVIYARLSIQDLLKDVDWAISLDGDTLWTGSPVRLMRLRDEHCLFLASEDPQPPGVTLAPNKWFKEHKLAIRPKESFCAGLMLLNLRDLRKFDFTKKAKEFLARYPDPPCPEQMVMSYLCLGRARALPKEWGVFSIYHTQVNLANGGLVHYVSDAPWRRNERNKILSDIVMLWYAFAKEFLGMHLLLKYCKVQDVIAKRAVYLVLKAFYPILRSRPWVEKRWHNLAGLSRRELRIIKAEWRKGCIYAA